MLLKVIRFVIILIKKAVSMARPRTVNLEGGKVELHGFTPEVADKIQDVLKNMNGAPPEMSSALRYSLGAQNALAPVKTEEELSNFAVGWNLNSTTNKHEVVIINYNNDVAVVKETRVVNFRVDAINALKLELFKRNLI